MSVSPPSPSPPWAVHLPPGVAAGGVDLLARRSLPAAWVSHWRREPDRPVVRDPRGAWLTGGDLLERTARVAGRLAAAGIGPGDRVLLSGPASADLVVAHCAALRAGCVVVPANATYTRRELQVIASDAEPRAVLVADERMRGWVAAAAAGGGRRPPVVAGPDVALADGQPPELDVAGPADPALLPYTSGTTGTPKGALLSHGNLLASAEGLLLAWRWTADDRLVLCLPLFHMHGLGVGLHGTLLAGAQAVLVPRFDVDAVLAEVAAREATLFFGVPTMYARLAEAPDLGPLAGLRLCVSGSAPLAAELHARIAERTGQKVLERYGMTETVMLASNPYAGDRRPGTVGRPLPGVELRLAAGTGEIEVRGPNVFAGYWGRPEASAEAFTPDGWFRTGDLGAWDAAGYLRIVGRAKELIITGGYNVYPREVEDVLRAHPAVVDVAVAGVPSAEWGETVTAYVEAAPGFDAEALAAWAADRLAPYKRPRAVHRVEALPRNSLGKVVRSRLAAFPDNSGGRT